MCSLRQVRLHGSDCPAQHVGAAAEAPPAEGTGRGGQIWAGIHAKGRNLDHRQQKKQELVFNGRGALFNIWIQRMKYFFEFCGSSLLPSNIMVVDTK